MRENYCKEDVLKKDLELNYKFLKRDFQEIESLKEDTLNGIQRYPLPNETVIFNRKSAIYRYIDEIIRIKYSLGYPGDEIGDTYIDGIDVIKEIRIDDIGYVHFLQFFSLGILLGIPKEKIEILINVMDEDGIDDLLLDYLVGSLGFERKIKSKGYQKEKPYAELMGIVDLAKSDKTKAEEKFEKYTEKNWLKGHSDYGWVKFHKEAGYYGLWSFDSGVVSKILNLDDARLVNSIHYPYDLVHYREDLSFESYTIENRTDNLDTTATNYSIDDYPELNGIVPNEFRLFIKQAIIDYNSLSDSLFFQKYELKNIWFTEDEFIAEKKKGILGFVIVNLLVDKKFILQLDHKEDVEDYIDDIKSFWGCKEKIVEFDLENDQVYLAKIPEDTKLDKLFEVQIRALTQ